MEFKERTLAQLADMVCGNSEPGVPCFFRYRSSSYLTEFFEDCDTDYRHDGSTRKWWVAGTLRQILSEPQPYPNTPPDAFAHVIRTLMDPSDAVDEGPDRPGALALRWPVRGTRRSTLQIGCATCAMLRPTRLQPRHRIRIVPSRRRN